MRCGAGTKEQSWSKTSNGLGNRRKNKRRSFSVNSEPDDVQGVSSVAAKEMLA
jgi:hypothetical protein